MNVKKVVMSEATYRANSNLALLFKEFEKDWREYNAKGTGAYVGTMWGRHPSWGVDPKSKAYRTARWKWHQNLGELLNYHGNVHIGGNGASSRALRLTVSLTHTDVRRLMEVQQVAGGRVASNPHHTRTFTYEARDDVAQSVLRCGRLFCDPKNEILFDIINAAVSFRRNVPRRGGAKAANAAEKNEQALAAQHYWKEQVDRLMGMFHMKQHDCGISRSVAGGTIWPTLKNS